MVFGPSFDGSQHLRHTACFRKEELWRLRGAKYVQSDLEGVFREVRRWLDQRPVLFSGTPCQVDGLYRYLPDSTMCRILAVTGNLKQAAEQMVKTALAVPGGHDNTSVLLARYKG